MNSNLTEVTPFKANIWYAEDGNIDENCVVFQKNKDPFGAAVEDKKGNLHGCNQLRQLWMELPDLVKVQERKELTVVEPLAMRANECASHRRSLM